MDHNLEDSLTMESIETMDFENAGVEVSQEDISLEDSTQEDNIHMDMDSIQEQPTLLEGGSEEVIVSDFIGDQFGFEEYSVQTENSSGANITIESNQLVQGDLMAQNEQIIDMQYAESSKPTTSHPGIITIKAIPQHRGTKKPTVAAPYPRQVAIAPKPIKGAPNVQYAIAPKPVAIMMNKNTGTPKTIPMKSVMQSIKGNTVLAQIGKQLVMVPAGAAGQKLKLSSILPGGSGDASNIQLVRCNTDSAQLIANKGNKPVRTKFIVQGQSNSDPANQPAVITKIMPATSSAPAQARYIMQQKTVPITIGGSKVVLSTTPTKQGVKVAPKKQIISIKTESPKVVTSQANVQTKKVVITANPASSQAKAAGTKTGTQIQGQRTQLHPINVPGKGIQYIKLVTNQPAAQKAASKSQPLSISGKNFVLTDSKGNILQMSSDKVLSTQPPPLLVTSTTTSASQVASKGRKLVRIAPISAKSDTSIAKVREVSKMAYCVEPKTPRASQSLLMPRSRAVLAGTAVSLEEFNEMVDQTNLNTAPSEETQGEGVLEEDVDTKHGVHENVDVKPTLASLISDAVSGEDAAHDMAEIEIEYESTPRKQEYYQDESTNSMEHESSNERHNENLIIVPSNVTHTSGDDDHEYPDDSNASMADGNIMQTVVSVEPDVMPYMSSEMDQDSMLVSEGGGAGAMRPRKVCNCSKSQCLKLYCDCFANGEFCNQCNCNNCFNNLDHEDTRQKAIRACLERNPNAFRPKIGKSKSGGPEIVRRHNKGCNCKRSGCLKNYCECYEAKIACTLMCKCVGCRNIEETLERRRDVIRLRDKIYDPAYRAPIPVGQVKQPCNFMTCEVIEAVAQCMLAAAAEDAPREDADPVEDVLVEFSRCMADIINASHHSL